MESPKRIAEMSVDIRMLYTMFLLGVLKEGEA
jgi:hypothetical protein